MALLCALIPVIGSARLALAENEAGDQEAAGEVLELEISEFDRDHWSFQPIERPPLPAVERSGWPSTAVDFFILRRLEKRSLAPQPAADRATLLRRVKFDLLGLPPTVEELERFEADKSPLAYERLVDRFLSSPGYAERWAQHWLDLARFAETDGFEHDKVRKGAWRYRQWVVDALNQDMPYDQFVRLQLAGDLVGSEDSIATMFCMAGPDMPDINEQDLRRHDKLNEIASTVGASLLGLQMHCAQCHDHKYDPISQADFYRLRGIFESAVPPLKRDRHVTELASYSDPIVPRLYGRGELSNAGPRLKPRPPRIASSDEPLSQFDNKNPRVALADWLFLPENPLTGRVIANRIWQHHFGKSLCENPSDFGVIADGPSHEMLLDWLAVELRQSGWNLKRLHRIILLSSTYRQASHVGFDGSDQQRETLRHAIENDPENEWYSRFPRRRLEGEIIRDALLSVSGQLNRSYGGQSVLPPLPDELVSTLLKGQWKSSEDPEDHVRRSIYVFARRNLRYPIFDAFDRPDAGASCARRDRSTTAIQSLHLLNSELAFDAARKFRDRLERETAGKDDAELLKHAFRLAFARLPTEDELGKCRELLAGEADRREALLIVCAGLLNASEFIYLD
ncbi:DUF1553 domain-containing protein [Roseiconus nitratireducens]|uniref:DUF1553 domain-containing protein n=2 Tax=Roseiconus nitratireducens TaxID=2605748 RepID=A0A5M6CUL0_9BACT|nr:DUF1553 domain-containing protein [Roseiconus nitratireducens]